jgi:putative membrane protein
MSILEAAVTNFIDRRMAQPSTPTTRKSGAQRDLARGIFAGLVAGVVATAAKTAVEKIYPPRTHGEPEPPAVLAEKVAGHELAPATKAVATESIHWAFGATVGAAYGALAEFYPAATSRDGINFGMTLMALTHESALPAMGLSATPADQSSRERYSEMASHIAYGLVAETTRRIVRGMI